MKTELNQDIEISANQRHPIDTMSKKKRYIKVKQVTQGSSYIDDINTTATLADLLDGAYPGEDEGYLVSIVEMTEEEFKALPEFDGF